MPFHFWGKMSPPQTVYFSISIFGPLKNMKKFSFYSHLRQRGVNIWHFKEHEKNSLFTQISDSSELIFGPLKSTKKISFYSHLTQRGVNIWPFKEHEKKFFLLTSHRAQSQYLAL